MLGSTIYRALDSNWFSTCDVMALIATAWTVIFFVFNIMPDLHKESKQRQEMAERFAEKGFLPVISVEDAEEPEVLKKVQNLGLTMVPEDDEELRQSVVSSS